MSERNVLSAHVQMNTVLDHPAVSNTIHFYLYPPHQRFSVWFVEVKQRTEYRFYSIDVGCNLIIFPHASPTYFWLPHHKAIKKKPAHCSC
jgi:hypothetical protein